MPKAASQTIVGGTDSAKDQRAASRLRGSRTAARGPRSRAGTRVSRQEREREPRHPDRERDQLRVDGLVQIQTGGALDVPEDRRPSATTGGSASKVESSGTLGAREREPPGVDDQLRAREQVDHIVGDDATHGHLRDLTVAQRAPSAR
jgi:hypothetical protein